MTSAKWLLVSNAFSRPAAINNHCEGPRDAADRSPSHQSLVPGLLVGLVTAIQTSALAADDPVAEAIMLNQQAAVLYKQGRYPEAELLYKAFLTFEEKALGPDHLMSPGL
jgi:hypothetical protein